MTVQARATFLPNGYRFRRGFFGGLVLQKKVPAQIIRGYSGDGWRDADANDVLEWGPWSSPPNEGTSGTRTPPPAPKDWNSVIKMTEMK